MVVLVVAAMVVITHLVQKLNIIKELVELLTLVVEVVDQDQIQLLEHQVVLVSF